MAHITDSAPHPAQACAPLARRALPARHAAGSEASQDAAAGKAARAWWWWLAEALAPPLAEGQTPQRGLWVV